MLQKFEFEGREIRFVEGKPVANDVAEVLGYVSPKDAVYRHVSDKNKGGAEVATPGGTQIMTILEEAGVYQLIFKSNLKSAEKFQDWVFEEVLPSIRKTGSYTKQLSPAELLLQQAQFLVDAEKRLNNIEQKQTALEDKLDPYLPQDGYVTMEAYQKMKKYSFKHGVGQMIYITAVSLHKANPTNTNLLLGSVSHQYKGSVTTYPIKLLDLCLAMLEKQGRIKIELKRSLTWISKL